MMKDKYPLTSCQMTALVVMRFLIGWHILYEGFSKLLIPNWSSLSFLQESKWIMSGFSNWIITHSNVLNAVDFLNTWGLIAIGLALILGIFTRLTSICGAVLLLIYYLNNPPLIGLEYTLPSEGSYLIVSKTLIEAMALVVLAVFPTGMFFGLDMLIKKQRNDNN